MPTQTLDEYLREVSLSRKKHLVVEGISDRRTWRLWAARRGLNGAVVIHEVGEISVSYRVLVSLGLTGGRRDEVIALAIKADSRALQLRCIADRDTGARLKQFSANCLLWTEFPALESYAFCTEVVDAMNSLTFHDRLPPGREVVATLSRPLAEIFVQRIHNEDLARPNFARAAKFSDGVFEFDTGVATGLEWGNEAQEIEVMELMRASDQRTWAYGHDVAPMIFFAYQTAMRGSGVSGVTAVENALIGAMHASGILDSSALAHSLESWILAP